MRRGLIKTGSILLLIIGILLFLAFLASALLIFVLFPEANMTKTSMLAVLLVIAAIVILLVAIVLYESLTEVLHLEKAVDELEEEIAEKDTKTKREGTHGR
jgi:uncharacterized membrane protein YbhN (UPF0104 family)